MNEQISYQNESVRLRALFARQNAKRPMMILDLPEDGGFLHDFLTNLAPGAVYCRPEHEIPLDTDIRACAALFRENSCDFLVAAGSHAAIGLARAVRYTLSGGELTADSSPAPHMQEEPAPPMALFPLESPGGDGFSGFLYGQDGRIKAVRTPEAAESVFFEFSALGALSEDQKKALMVRIFCGSVLTLWSADADEEQQTAAEKALQNLLTGAAGFLLGYPDDTDKIAGALSFLSFAQGTNGSLFFPIFTGNLALQSGLRHVQATGLALVSLWRYILKNPPLIGANFRRGCERMKAFFPLRTKKDAELPDYAQLFLEYLGCAAADERRSIDIGTLQTLCTPYLEAAPAKLSPEALAEIAADALAVEAPEDAARREELRQLQQLELEILLVTDAFCRQHGITYYLGEGTLLGAMRHQGFIPWDDDIDILMPREDYDRFIRLAKRDFPAGYNLDSFETNPRHWVLGAKIQMVRKTRFYQKNTASLAMYNGPYIDIFPLDDIGPKHRQSTKRQIRTVRLLRRFLFIKTGFSLAMKGKPQRYLMRFFSHFVSTPRLFRWINRAMRFQNKKGHTNLVNFCSYYNLMNEIYPARFFGTPRYMPFEGHLLPVPQEAEYMLKTIYGKDYMMLPPGALRSSRVHGFDVDENLKSDDVSTAHPLPAGGGPRVSVIVPVYKVERYLERCLNSLVSQTLEDLEIIVVNDGSPDNSGAIIQRYAAAYPDKIRAFNKKNGGLSDARNFGIEKARGEYIGFVDSDDYVAPDMYEKLLAKADSTGADAAVCRISRVSERENWQVVQSMPHRNSYGHSILDRPELILAVKPYAWNKLYRRSLFIDSGVRFPVGQYFEDSATIYNVLLGANRIELVDEALYYYIVDRPGSITTSAEHKFFDIFLSCDSIIRYYRSKGAWETCKDAVEEQCRTLIFVRLSAILGSKNADLRDRFLRQAYRYLRQNFPRWRKNPYYRSVWKNPLQPVSRRSRLKRHPLLFRVLLLMPRSLRNKVLRLVARKKSGPSLAPEDIKELQQIQLQILDVIDRLCTEHGITYYLAEGTLLGAVRHRGFIPWDDDTDVVMPRADYERFLALFSKGEIDGCALLNESVYERYHLTFSKLVTTKKTRFYNTVDDFPEEFRGPYVDIFPLDQGVAREDPRRVRKIRKYRDILLLKVGYIRPNSRRRLLYYCIRGFYSVRRLHRILHRLMTHYNGNPKADCLVNFASSYPPYRETAPAGAYGEPVRTEFEGRMLPIPRDSDLILRVIYGNYTQLPPEQKRIGKHSFACTSERKS